MTIETSAPSFADLGLRTELLSALSALGYATPTPVQAKSIPYLLEGRDILAQAQTGTGKTGAFAIPLLQNINLNNKGSQILVLTPTRELGIQVAEAFKGYAKDLQGFRVLPIYGGQSMSKQLSDLKRGAHVVVGTPGRVIDHLKRKTLKLDNIQAVVLDEADEMLKMGFIDDIEWILGEAPEERQTALFSATMPSRIKKIAQQHLKNEAEVKIKSKTQTVANIEQGYCIASGKQKFFTLNSILEFEEVDACLIFVKTKNNTVELAERLHAAGYSCSALNGDMNQSAREQTIQSLKNGRLDIVVATDVAARGLDVDRISHVVNYDAPYDTESYVHRIGRTGRAGRSGRTILFVGPREKRLLSNIQKATRQKMKQIALPSKEELEAIRAKRFQEKLSKIITTNELSKEHRFLAQLLEDGALELSDIAAALYHMTQEKKQVPIPEFNEDRGGRRSADGRAPRSRHSEPREVEAGMLRYRIDIGRRQGVTPASIVGGVASATGISGSVIGHISLSDHHTTVELPNDLSKDMLYKLGKIWINNEPYEAVEEGASSSMKRGNSSNSRLRGKNKDSRDGSKRRSSKVGKRGHRGKRPSSTGSKSFRSGSRKSSARTRKAKR